MSNRLALGPFTFNLSRIHLNCSPMILRSLSINISIRNVLGLGTRKPPTWKEPPPGGSSRASACVFSCRPSYKEKKTARKEIGTLRDHPRVGFQNR